MQFLDLQRFWLTTYITLISVSIFTIYTITNHKILSDFAKIFNLNMHKIIQYFLGSCHHPSMPKTLSYKMKIHEFSNILQTRIVIASLQIFFSIYLKFIGLLYILLGKMNQAIITPIFLGILACWSAISVTAEDRYQFFTWEITKGTIFPLGVPQEVSLFYHCCLK